MSARPWAISWPSICRFVFYGSVRDSEIYFALYVDDGLIIERPYEALSDVIQALQGELEVTLEHYEIFVDMQLIRGRKKVQYLCT